MEQLDRVVVVPLIVGLVEMAKRLGLPSRFAAAVSLSIGVALSAGAWVATRAGGRDLFDSVLFGMAVGLSASGLYSVARALGNKAPPLGPDGYQPDGYRKEA